MHSTDLTSMQWGRSRKEKGGDYMMTSQIKKLLLLDENQSAWHGDNALIDLEGEQERTWASIG